MIEDYQALSNAPNSPDLNGKYLGLISSDFILVSELLKEASYQIKKRGFSDFPVFVTSQRPIEIGQKLIGVNEMNGNKWNYHASTLEEFLQRGLVAEENKELFVQNYKDIEEFACLFVVDGQFTNFVFIPFPEEMDNVE
ncbi:hypothetical protein G9H64_08740 [Aquirufa nivalisilvae]|uniref:Uncharacterized protein n=3 Tax=Aquirufa TaxID=2676247 RepID=A0A2S2DTV6_9BACT|nr:MULTISPECIES: hypothetical protein [Aquirufa]AWL08806.1 hypothetical protein HME7025_00937 [Aquirufa nivalisilvae]MCZ2479280.1 hypothetical protein [Aquirufa nivalisilvae]MCZ2483041.1 hypothetical protein [Aquirufa nivalisilvae]NHC50198.1 hypothetical protein [Aquirufa ecclesiirivi]TBH74825.1 hypothetical protein EWU22_06580 [Aquirufa nivalisilvae]